MLALGIGIGAGTGYWQWESPHGHDWLNFRQPFCLAFSSQF